MRHEAYDNFRVGDVPRGTRFRNPGYGPRGSRSSAVHHGRTLHGQHQPRQVPQQSAKLLPFEAAFNLLRDYVGSEINQELTSAEFIALLRSDEYVVVRDCSMNESINTGGLYWNGQSWEFSWFVRSCRAGEQIIQFKLGNQRIDLISLNCLNAVEPKVTVTFEFNRRVPPAIPRRPVVSMTTTITSSPDDYRGQPTLLMGAAGPRYAGGDLTIDVLGTAGAGSVSSAAAQSGGGNCTPSCPTTPDQ